MPYIQYVERIVEYYSGKSEIFNTKQALLKFEELSGRFEDTDPWYEERSRLFFDYLVFDYPSPPFRSIVHRYFFENARKLEREGVASVYRGFLSTQPGVFSIEKVGEHYVVLRDLIGNVRYRILKPEEGWGLEKRVVINTRIIPFRGNLVMGHGILIHPEDASEHIERLVEDLRKEGLLGWESHFLLARMKLLHDTSPSFKISTIYSIKSFLIKRS